MSIKIRNHNTCKGKCYQNIKNNKKKVHKLFLDYNLTHCYNFSFFKNLFIYTFYENE